MRKIKIAQIGIGHDHAGAVTNALLKNNDIFDFVGYSMEMGEEKFIKDGYGEEYRLTTEEILNNSEIEAVAIETEDKNLTEFAIKAAEKGLHIHMDKPGGVSDADFEKLIKIVNRNKTVFHTGYMYRYNPAIIQLMEDIKSGKLGDIYSVEAHMSCEHKAEKRQWLADYPGGMMHYLGCHLIDLILSIQGVPEEIIPFNTCVGQEGVTADDFGMAVLKYKNGVSFAKTTAMEVGGFRRRQLVVCGTKGTVEIKPLEWYDDAENTKLITGINQVYRDKLDDVNWGRMDEGTKTDQYDRYKFMMRSFAAMVRGEKKNPYTYEYELLLHKVLLNACGIETDYKSKIVL